LLSLSFAGCRSKRCRVAADVPPVTSQANIMPIAPLKMQPYWVKLLILQLISIAFPDPKLTPLEVPRLPQSITMFSISHP
jgi:hypothetical protein